MDRERYQRLKDLFHRAEGLAGDELGAFVEASCGGDDELADALRGMLGAGAPSGAVDRALEEPDGVASPTLPQHIGRYRVVRLIGHGGMGTVYEAEQQSPRRRVAVKVVHASLLRPETRRRFRREAEILGRLQHPGIAQVYEAGEAELHGGLVPFIAMEYVVGAPLLRHVEERALGVDERVDLFCRICDAVQHAHERGVVHRDLKPDNVLVVERTSSGGVRGHPKVLDFGVARLTSPDLQATLSTGTGHIVGSLASMSPEQAAGGGARVDARSDVYSLGMVLFELLSGRLPYRVDDRPLADVLDVIRNDEPAALDDVAPALAGDLATIVGKCLEKAPERRYASAAALADDLRRHRRRETIVARPPSSWQQARRFARRHRALVVGSVAVLVALGVGLALAVASAVDARRSEQRAVVEALRANLLAADALVSSDPSAARRALEAVPEAMRGWEWRHLHARLARSLLDFGAYHPAAPLVVVDDGARVLAAADASTLVEWDVETGAERARHVAPDDAVAWAVAPGGERVAAATDDGRVLVTPRATTAWASWAPAGGAVVRLVFAPDGATLAVVREDGVEVGGADGWWRVDGTSGAPSFPAFSPDGARLVVGVGRAYAPFVIGVDLATRTVDRREALGEDPADVVWTADDRVLVAGGNRSMLELDPTTLARRRRLVGHSEPVVDVDAERGGRVASVARDGTLRVWRADGQALTALDAPGVAAAAFAGRDRIISASREGLRLWDLGADARAVLGGHGSYVYDLAFSPDGRQVVSVVPFEDRHLALWDLVDGRRLARAPLDVWKPDLAFGSDARVALGATATLDVVDLASRRSERRAVSHALSFGAARREPGRVWFSSGGEADAPARTDEPVVVRVEHRVDGGRVWVDGEPVPLVGESPGTPGIHPRLCVGNLRAGFGGFAGRLRDLVVLRGEPSRDDLAALEAALGARWHGHDVELPSPRSASVLAHLDADPRWLETSAVEGDDETGPIVEAWRARRGAVRLRSLGAMPSAVRAETNAHGAAVVRFANVTRRVGWLEGAFDAAAGAETVTVLVSGVVDSDWRAGISTVYSIGEAKRGLVDWDGRPAAARRLGVGRSLSADGRRVAESQRGEMSSVIVRDAATGHVLAAVGRDVYGAELSPDGQRVAGARHDGHVTVWDVDTGGVVTSFVAHASEAYAVTWSHDGRRLVSGGNDNLVRVWDTATWEPLLTLRGHGQYVKAVAFSPDGTRLASASGDGTVRVWDATDPAARHAEHLARRALTDELRAEVTHLCAGLDGQAAADAVRARWSDDAERRTVALTLLAAGR